MRIVICLLCAAATTFAQPFPDVIFDRTGRGSESRYGAGVFSLGDQNDDGFMDWGVWAQGEGEAGEPSEEMAEFFHGGDPPSEEPYMTWTADPDTALDITSVKSMGDINGDGYQDWKVSMRYGEDYGSLFIGIYWGGPDASTEPEVIFEFVAGQQSIKGMGGDFNGDGYDDLYSYNNHHGLNLIYFGGQELDTIPDMNFSNIPHNGAAESFGDLNGDDLIDFVAGAPTPYSLQMIFFGSTSPDTVPEIVWEDFFDTEVTIVNDLNGDGRDDLLTRNSIDQIYVHYGGEEISREPDAILNFNGCPTDGINEMIGIGDFNDDGYGDFTVFSWGCANGHGKMSLYLGYRWQNPNPVLEVVGRTPPLELVGPRRAAALGDVNGDGIDDFATGAWNFSFDGNRGRCVVLAGNPEYIVPVDHIPPVTPSEIFLTAYPNPFNAETTIEMELPASSGTVDLKIFNTLGQVVHQQKIPAWGEKITYRWDGTDNGVPVVTGMYIARASFNQSQTTAKLIALR